MTACPKCGQVHQRDGKPTCSAHIKSGDRKGQPCLQYPKAGVPVCRVHGGGTRAAKAAGERRVEEARIATKVGELLDQVAAVDQHPIDGLLEAVHRTGDIARALSILARDLDLRPQLGVNEHGGIGITDALYGPDHNLDGRPHVLLDMLRVWTELHAKACKLALDAGIDERRLQLEEAEVDQLMQAILRAITAPAVALTPTQQEALTVTLAGELRALEA